MHRTAFFVLSAASFASFLSSVFLIFRTPPGPASRMLAVMKIGSIATWAVGLIAIARSQSTESIMATVAFSAQLASLALFWFAASAIERHRLTIAFIPAAPDALISSGPFRVLLHPFYTAYVLSYWSVFAYTLHWATAVAAASMHGLYAVSAKREEALLQRAFGDAYTTARRMRHSPFPSARSATVWLAGVLASIVVIAACAVAVLPSDRMLLGDSAMKAVVEALAEDDSPYRP